MPQITDTVLELQGVLTRLEELKKQHADVPESMTELKKQHDSVEAEIATLEETLAEAEVERRSAEGEVEDEQQKAEQYQSQISGVQTQREYGALLSEIDTSKGKAKESEERALAAGERHEETTKTLDELRSQFAEQDQEYQEKLAEWKKERPAVADQIKTLEADAERLREDLPPLARGLFQRLYDMHDGQPIARIIAVERINKKAKTIWRCSECNYSIRPQLVVEVRTSEELVLSECCRQKILVVDEPVEAEAE